MKPETQKIAVFILFLAVSSVIIYYLIQGGKKPKTYVQDKKEEEKKEEVKTEEKKDDKEQALFPLKKGMKQNKYVIALQKGMNQKYFTKLDEDGKFGNNTQNAVEKHLDQNYLLKPSVTGVSWKLFQKEGFDKLVK